MGKALIVTVATEGWLYSLDKDANAPIRFYSDRTVEDDILRKFNGRPKRVRLTRAEFRRVRRAAQANRVAGLV